MTAELLFEFMPFALDDFAVAACMSVRLSVTRLYCVQTAKTTLKLFRPSDSPIMLIF